MVRSGLDSRREFRGGSVIEQRVSVRGRRSGFDSRSAHRRITALVYLLPVGYYSHRQLSTSSSPRPVRTFTKPETSIGSVCTGSWVHERQVHYGSLLRLRSIRTAGCDWFGCAVADHLLQKSCGYPLLDRERNCSCHPSSDCFRGHPAMDRCHLRRDHAGECRSSGRGVAVRPRSPAQAATIRTTTKDRCGQDRWRAPLRQEKSSETLRYL